jgi:hypothetical protein
MAKDIKVDGPAGLPLPTPTKKTSIKRTISFTGPDAEAQAAQYREAAKNDAKQLSNKSLRESVQQRNAQVVVQKRTDATKANLQPSPNKTDPTAPKSGPQALDDAAATAAHTTPGQIVLTTTGASEILKQLKQITLPKPGQDRPDADLVKSLLNKLGNVSSPMSSIGTDANAICNFMMNMELAGFPMGEMSNLQIMLLLLEMHAQDKDLLNAITMTSHMSDIAQKKLQEKKTAVSQMFEKLDLTLGSVQGSLKAITSSHEAGNKIGEGILQVKSGVATEAAHAAEGRIAQRNAEAETMGRGHATDRALGEMHATRLPTPPPAADAVTGNGPLSALLSLPATATPSALARIDTALERDQAVITRLSTTTPLSAEQRTELTQARGRLAVGLQRKADFLALNPTAAPARGTGSAAANRAAMEANLQALDAECGRVGRREIEGRIQEIRRDELPAPPPSPPAAEGAPATASPSEGVPMTQLRASVARGLTESATALRAAQVNAARLEAPAPATDPVGSGPLGDAAAGSTTGTQDPTLQALYDTPPVPAPATPPTPPATVPSEADRRASAIYARALPAVERERAVINNPSSTPAQRAAAHGRIQATLQRASDACRARGGALPEGLTAATAANEQAMERLIGGTGMLRFNEANLTRRQADLAAITPAPTGLANANHQLDVERATVSGSREAGALEAVLQQRIAEAQQARFALESFRLRTNAGSHMSEAAKGRYGECAGASVHHS